MSTAQAKNQTSILQSPQQSLRQLCLEIVQRQAPFYLHHKRFQDPDRPRHFQAPHPLNKAPSH